MCVCALLPSRVPLFDTLWTVTIRLLCPWDFPSKNTCSVLPFPTSGYLPGPGIELASLASSALVGGFFTTMPPGKPHLS